MTLMSKWQPIKITAVLQRKQLPRGGGENQQAATVLTGVPGAPFSCPWLAGGRKPALLINVHCGRPILQSLRDTVCSCSSVLCLADRETMKKTTLLRAFCLIKKTFIVNRWERTDLFFHFVTVVPHLAPGFVFHGFSYQWSTVV